MTPDLNSVLDSLKFLVGGSFSEGSYIAQKTVEYTTSLTNNTINRPEYNDLMADLKVDELVTANAEEEEIKSKLQTFTQQIFVILSSLSSFV
jgi:hypothetical protein